MSDNLERERMVITAGSDGQDALKRRGIASFPLSNGRRSSRTGFKPRVKPREPAANLIESALLSALNRLTEADPAARRGEVEGVHRLRTATRRLRSELRTVRSLIHRDWREHLEQELKWLATALGNVRDLDILTQRLRVDAVHLEPKKTTSSNTSLSAEEDRLLDLFRHLRKRHEEHARGLRESLQSPRYQNLLAELRGSIQRPALKDEACEPSRTVLPPLALHAWRALRKKARALEPTDANEKFHEVRKLAKRARYAAELIAPALGHRREHRARRFIRLTTRVQDILGEHQDATVAISEMESFLAEPDEARVPDRNFHELLEREREAERAARAAFFETWDKLDRKRSLRWMKGRAKVGR
jgi:CHAD domain-containing protein